LLRDTPAKGAPAFEVEPTEDWDDLGFIGFKAFVGDEFIVYQKARGICFRPFD
jgi:hypothetical protein